MSNVSISYLGKIAPEYANFSDTERFNIVKGIAECSIDESVFGCKSDYAVALLIAHILKTGDIQGIGGEVTKDKNGDVERQYAASGVSGDGYSTVYSRELTRLKKATIIKSPLMMGIDRSELTW